MSANRSTTMPPLLGWFSTWWAHQPSPMADCRDTFPSVRFVRLQRPPVEFSSVRSQVPPQNRAIRDPAFRSHHRSPGSPRVGAATLFFLGALAYYLRMAHSPMRFQSPNPVRRSRQSRRPTRPCLHLPPASVRLPNRKRKVCPAHRYDLPLNSFSIP